MGKEVPVFEENNNQEGVATQITNDPVMEGRELKAENVEKAVRLPKEGYRK